MATTITLPPTTYAPNLDVGRPFAVHYRSITGERVQQFASSEARDMWLAVEAPRGTEILAVLNRVDPSAIPLRWRRSQQPQDFRADVLAARVDPDAFPRWRSMHLESYARSGDLTHLADAAYCGAVMDAASREDVR